MAHSRDQFRCQLRQQLLHPRYNLSTGTSASSMPPMSRVGMVNCFNSSSVKIYSFSIRAWKLAMIAFKNLIASGSKAWFPITMRLIFSPPLLPSSVYKMDFQMKEGRADATPDGASKTNLLTHCGRLVANLNAVYPP